ncbi:MAG TPA: VOC family protein [Candidatus Nitrosotenuis sp.]|nr:VOC family protein [Candidatus Nitrosotenuis sp.]
MPALNGIVETALYVDDLARSVRFFSDVFGFVEMVGDERLCALRIREGQVLLLLKRGASLGHEVPHDGSGQTHLAFAIPANEYAAWREHLQRLGVQALREWKRFAESMPSLSAWMAARFPQLPDGSFDISFTRFIFGSPPEFAEKPFRLALYTEYGGWLSLIVFAAVAYILMRGPLQKKLPE